MNTDAPTYKRLSRIVLPFMAAALALIVTALLLTVSVFAGGPANRPTFTSAKPADYVVFNAITDNPEHGDERNFVLIREAGVGTYVNELKLQPGKEYEVYSYYHNNAKSSLNTGEGTGIAQNVRMSADVPTIGKPGERGKISTSITSTNANPAKVWDEAYITTDSEVAIRYVPASAKITSGGAVNGKTLSESLFSTTGTFIGYNELNGILPGCADYAGYVVYKLKVDQPNFDVTKDVSVSGEAKYSDQVNSKAGAKVDYKISYKNTGTTDQKDVTIKDVLPKGISYVPGSTKITNNANPNGLAVGDGITANGINIGTYGPGASAVITFTAQITDKQNELTCGKSTLVNEASVITGNGTKKDTARVVVQGDGESCIPAELPTTGPAELAAALLGVALVSLGIVYWLRSRSSYKKALAGIVETPTHHNDDDEDEVAKEALLVARKATDADNKEKDEDK